jgi:hypothetical protein
MSPSDPANGMTVLQQRKRCCCNMVSLCARTSQRLISGRPRSSRTARNTRDSAHARKGCSVTTTSGNEAIAALAKSSRYSRRACRGPGPQRQDQYPHDTNQNVAFVFAQTAAQPPAVDTDTRSGDTCQTCFAADAQDCTQRLLQVTHAHMLVHGVLTQPA